MRVNTRRTLAAFVAGRAARPASSIWTDGVTIWSYGTVIATRLPSTPGTLLFNATRYSVTTSIHQNALAVALREEGFELIEFTGISRGGCFSEQYRPLNSLLIEDQADEPFDPEFDAAGRDCDGTPIHTNTEV